MLQNQYRWQATQPDGTVINEGGDLSGAVLVSLIPENRLFPQHDLMGLKFVRRFGRGFVNALGGGIREYVHCIVCECCRVYVRSTDGTVLVTPPDYELYL